MTHVLLVLGGARSGKSAYAEERVRSQEPRSVVYVATLLGEDCDVQARIAAHQARRPRGWTVVEVDSSGDVATTLARTPVADVVLVDGVDLALALADCPTDEAAEEWARATAAAVRSSATRFACLVSAEVGLGVVPATVAGVHFRDRLGIANQVLARLADEVVLLVAGCPLTLRSGPA